MIELDKFTAGSVLALIFLGLFIYLRKDVGEYERLKAQTESAIRQKIFLKWTLQSFFMFSVFAVTCLVIFGRVENLFDFPTEFTPLRRALINFIQDGDDYRLPIGYVLAGSLVMSSALGGIIASRFASKKDDQSDIADHHATVGDFAALIPRNAAERKLATLISLNAGIGEEIFFRLTLPLFLFFVLDNAVVAFLIASIVFGVMHIYQGWVGVLATGFLGLVFTFLYIWTGTLLLPIIVHVLIDMNGLVLRSYLMNRAKN